MDATSKKQPSYLNKYARVPPNSQDWARIEYSLQLAIGSSTVSLRNIWSIANPNMTLNFQRKNKDLLVLDSWLETSILDETNRPEKVCQKGFDFPPGGLLFPTGHVTLNQDNYSGKNRLYEFFLVRVAVGRSYCVSMKTGNMVKEKRKLPYGFDSIYLIHDEEDEESKVFKHDYIIFDNTQVLPIYIVQFEFDTQKEEALSTPVCDLCGENQANIYCKAEEANFCFYCDEEHHAKLGKLVNKHARIPISERPKQFGRCQQHPEYTLEFFCANDNEPLCVYCKINGSHSTGDKTNHPLLKISEAYQKAMAESKEIDPILEKKKNQLTDTLSQIDVKIKYIYQDINKNASEVEENIYAILQEALRMLQEETQRKLSFLIADQIEIKRQYEQIQWLQSFLRYQQDILNPADYLNAWSRHLNLRTDIINQNIAPSVSNIQPDMRVEGKVTVVSDAKLRQGKEVESDVEQMSQEEMASLGSGNKFRSNIFGKNDNSLIRSIGYNSLKNVIPLSAQRLAYGTGDSNRKYQMDESMHNMDINKQTRRIEFSSVESGLFSKGLQPSNPLFSLRAFAEERWNQLRKNPDPTIQSGQFFKSLFPSSLILEGEEKKILYLNIPFDVKDPPALNLIWYRPDASTDGPEIQDLFIKKENQYPNLILFKHGDMKFGGYASDPWIFKRATPFGDNTCFLFNLNEDAKLLPMKEDNIMYLWQGPSSFSFGNYDLQIEENFNEVSSEVELNYFTGRNLNQSAAKKFLTGVVGKFKPDIVEVYTIMPSNTF